MPTRGTLAVWAVLLVLSAAGADPPARVHFDPGHHTGPVWDLFFRDADRELVSVGTDRSIRVWDLAAPPAGKPRAKAAYFLPANPTAVALNPKLGERYLACAFDVDTNARAVRVIDLNGPGNAVPPSVPVTCDTPLNALAFSADGKTLAVGGGRKAADNQPPPLWLWDGAWGKPDPGGLPAPLDVPHLRGSFISALAFDPTDQLIAVGARQDNKDAPPAPPLVVVGRRASPPEWRAYKLPASNAIVYDFAWSEHGLSVAYVCQTKSRPLLARVAVFPNAADGWPAGIAIDGDLGPGRARAVAWLSRDRLAVAQKADNDDTYRPRVVAIDRPAGRAPRLVPVRDGDPCPELGRGPNGVLTPAALTNEAGVSTLIGGNTPGTLAWASAATGMIRVARGGSPELLEPASRHDWLARLGWKSGANELVMTQAGGASTPFEDFKLWKHLNLIKDAPVVLAPRVAKHEGLVADLLPTVPPYCSATLASGWKVDGYAGHLVIHRPKTSNAPAVVFPADASTGVRSVVAFDNANSVITLGTEGRVTFWQFNYAVEQVNGIRVMVPTGRAQEVAHGYFIRGRLQIVWQDGTASLDRNGSSVVRVDPDVVRRQTYGPGGPDPWAPLFRFGPHPFHVVPENKPIPFQIEAPGAGQLRVFVGKREVSKHDVTTGEVVTVTPTFAVGDRELVAKFVGAGDGVMTHPVTVEPVGKIVLLDVTPQTPDMIGEVTQGPDAQDAQKRYRKTATCFRELFKALGQKVVERHATTAFGATRLMADITQPQPGETALVQPNDCVVILLKGHARRVPVPKPPPPNAGKPPPPVPNDGEFILDGGRVRTVFLTDDTVLKDLDAPKLETGLTREVLDGLIGSAYEVTKKIVVVIDCCHAEELKEGLTRRDGVSFYLSSLRTDQARPAVIPTAVRGLAIWAEYSPRKRPDLPNWLRAALPGGAGGSRLDHAIVYSDDILEAIRIEAQLVAVRAEYGTRWGYGTPATTTFPLGWAE